MDDQEVIVHPSQDDGVVAALSHGVGGPLGRHAGGHRWWTPVRVVLAVVALTMSLGMVSKSGCYEKTWFYDTHQYTHMCYSDLPYLYTGRGLAELDWPYSSDPQTRERYQTMEYPVGISYFAYGAAWVTHWVSDSPDVGPRSDVSVGSLSADPQVLKETRAFVIVNALVFAALALLSAWLLAGVDRRRPWDAMIFAASPVLALTGLINWDVLAVVLTAAALYTWARGRPVATGVLIGLGTATKLYPLFLLGAILIICARERRWADFRDTVFAAVGAWVLINAPGYLSGPTQWHVFWQFNEKRGPDLGSIWLVISQSAGVTISAHTVNVVSWLVFGVWCVGVLVIGLRAPTTPRLAQLGFLIVVGFLLINKVYSPQYVLWLLPLAVLARPRWRDQLIWQATEVIYFASVWWYLAGQLAPGGGDGAAFYWYAIVLRMLGELYLAAIITRDILWPRYDAVRASRQPPAGSATTLSSTSSTSSSTVPAGPALVP